ncbi:hypothetical protein Tco_1412399, partial [Tanacetum coccineum]
WGNNEDESDDDNADDSGNDDDGGNDANDTKKTDSDEEENPTLNLKDEEYDELYKDVNMKSKVAEQEEVGKKDAEMTDVVRESGSQEMSYVQVVEDAHMTLTPSQKTEGSKQSSPVSSELARRIKHSSTPLLTVPVTAIPATFTIPATTVPLSIHPITPIPLQSTPTPTPTTNSTTISILALPYFSSLFGFDNTVSTLEKDSRIGFATQTALQSYTAEFEKKTQAEKDNYIGLIENSIKDIINDEVKSQLPQIPPKEVSDYVTLMIQSTITKSLKNVMLAKSSSQPQSTYEAASSLIEFELKKILLDKIQRIKSYKAAPKNKELYESLVKSYNLDKDLFSSYEGHEYPFDLSKPLPLIEDRGRQVVHADYFINNDLEYLKGGSSSRKYTTSTTRTNVAKYNNIEGMEDMVPIVKVMKWYDYEYLEEIKVQRDDNKLYKFKEGDFPRLNLCDIKDMLLLLVQQKLSNLEVDD